MAGASLFALNFAEQPNPLMKTALFKLTHGIPAVIAVVGMGCSAARADDFQLLDPTAGSNLTLGPPQSPLNLGAFDIVISAGAGLSGNAPALAAFNRAAQQWEAYISDPITVTITADLGALGAGIIGSASAVILQASYTTIRNQMVADAANEADDSIAAFLPTAGQFTLNLAGGSSYTGNLLVTKANAKALGFGGLDGSFGVSDAAITFSSTFAFDYDNSDGVGAGLLDFETVAAHELGHALGFISAVDDADAGDTTISPFTLDLFRFRNGSPSDPSTNAEFTTFARDLVAGQPDVFDDLTNEWLMSTGVALGDGRQASHWKDDSLTSTNIGVMDPTLANAVFFDVGASDLRAMDLIGYEIVTVPEPATIMISVLACGILLTRRARRRMSL